MSEKGFGCCGVVDPTGNLLGIVTDGDLRRHMSHDLMTRLVDDIMTASPRTIRPDALVGEALELMELQKIMSLFAVEGRRPVGVIHMHDLLRIGLV
jgi:arabinose-5-phosphate isomerase